MKPLLLDLYCGAGGAARGYQRAGFHVVGVDIEPQPNYAGDEFYQRDAIEQLARFGRIYDAIHASPPCQNYSTVSGTAKRHHGATYPDLIPATRELLRLTGRPYVIENVINAPLVAPVRYCGSSFGLNVRRHRLFESSIPLAAPPCDHDWQTPRFRSLDGRRAKAGRLAAVVGVHGNIQYAGEFPLRCEAMGIDWMTNAELVEAVPPAFTEHVGRQLAEHLLAPAVAA